MPIDDLELELSPEPESVIRARAAVETFASTHGICAGSLHALKLAVSEACTNVVLHAYRDGRAGPFRVSARAAGGRRIRVDVSDEGPGIVPRVDSPGLGLGLSLIAAVADDLSVDRVGGRTHVRMCFSLDTPMSAFAAA